jgi:hypothetical protein
MPEHAAPISDIDAPHLLRDLARGEKIAGNHRTAARLRTLADEVAVIVEAYPKGYDHTKKGTASDDA